MDKWIDTVNESPQKEKKSFTEEKKRASQRYKRFYFVATLTVIMLIFSDMTDK